MKEKAMQSMTTLSSAQIVAGLPHPAYHHTVHERHAFVFLGGGEDMKKN